MKSNTIMESEKEQLQVAVTQNDIRAIRKEVETVAEKVNDVHQALIGNSLAKDGGIVQRLHDCERDVEFLRTKVIDIEKNNVKAGVYMKVIWGMAGIILAALLNHFFGK